MGITGTTTSAASIRWPGSTGNPVIDPTEWRGMAIGTPLGAIGGGIVGSLAAGERAARLGLQGTRSMDRALLHGGAMGAATGAALGLVAGFLVGHVQDEGWTIPGT